MPHIIPHTYPHHAVPFLPYHQFTPTNKHFLDMFLNKQYGRLACVLSSRHGSAPALPTPPSHLPYPHLPSPTTTPFFPTFTWDRFTRVRHETTTSSQAACMSFQGRQAWACFMVSLLPPSLLFSPTAVGWVVGGWDLLQTFIQHLHLLTCLQVMK